MKLVHVDVETTGLDPNTHDICEIAWMTEDTDTYEMGDIKYGKLDYEVNSVDPVSMEINKFYDRQADLPWADLNEFLLDVTGATLVGMNVRFDADFILRRLNYEMPDRESREPWSYRLLDIQAYAMGVLNSNRPLGSRDIQDILKSLGFEFKVESDHSAKNDVLAQTEAFHCLRKLNNEIYRSSHMWDKKY